MGSEWSEYRFGELCDISRGASPRPIKDFIAGSGMPWVKIADATSSESKFISATKEKIKPEGVLKSVTVYPGDLILSNSATPGLPRFMKIEACIHDGWMLLKNFRRLDKEFAFWLLLHERKNLVAQGNGSVFTNLKTDILRNHRVRIPPLEEQHSIAVLLNSLTDKIQLNSEINQNLEQMAQTIFKSWFVDFEPVKAKIATLEAGGSEEDTLLAAMRVISGKDTAALIRFQNEQPDQYNELHTIAELFPSAMQDSEFGEIPEGWKAGSLSNLAVFSSERITKEELTLKTYISTENMLEYKNGICEAASLPSSATVPRFEPGQILISNIRPYFKKIWFASMSGGRSPDVLGFTCKLERTNEFVFNLLYQDKFFDYMMLTSKGAKMPRGDKKAILQFGCVLPPISLMRLFSERVKQFYNMINSNKAESIVLTSVRETLLPKLLSGELPISKSIFGR